MPRTQRQIMTGLIRNLDQAKVKESCIPCRKPPRARQGAMRIRYVLKGDDCWTYFDASLVGGWTDAGGYWWFKPNWIDRIRLFVAIQRFLRNNPGR